MKVKQIEKYLKLQDSTIEALEKLYKVQVICNKSNSELRLMCGELSAQELRAVRAVLDILKGML